MLRAVILFFLIVSGFLNPQPLQGQSREQRFADNTDPRGEVELVVCSQNLNNYGTQVATSSRSGISAEDFAAKEAALIKRFTQNGCDVIAVQEVLAKNEEQGKKVLRQLSKELRDRTGRFFEVAIGSSSDPNLRNGFLVAKDRAEIMNLLSYTKVELPKISPDQKPRLFSRGPLEMQIMVKGQGESKARAVTLINLHFKSKSGSAGDPTGLEWETYRMEMAEALRRIVENRHKQSLINAESPVVVLGDRNANFDLASAQILEGVYSLGNFQKDGGCRLSKRGVPLCKPDIHSPAILFSVLTSDPVVKQQAGTFQFKGVYSWIDDILLPAETLRLAWRSFDVPGKYDAGVVYSPENASDHAMVYVKLNW